MGKNGIENQSNTNTGGGSYTEGSVKVKNGDFVGRDKVTVQVSLGVVAIIVLISVLLMFNSSVFQANFLPTVTAKSIFFTYQVSIQTLTGDLIQNANVVLEIGGKAPLNDVSDSAGLARIMIETSYQGKPARLIVKVGNYKTYTQNIDLTENDLPKVIQLNPAP